MLFTWELSLVPRPSPAPVFDGLQYAKTKRSKTGAGEGLGTRLWELTWEFLLITMILPNELQMVHGGSFSHIASEFEDMLVQFSH